MFDINKVKLAVANNKNLKGTLLELGFNEVQANSGRTQLSFKQFCEKNNIIYIKGVKKDSSTDLEFSEAVKNSKSVAEVIRKLNIRYCGGNIKAIKMRCLSLNLSTLHFTGTCWNKGLTANNSNSVRKNANSNKSKIVFDINTRPKNARKWYIRERKENNTYYCDDCSISKWQNKEITLQLEHIDGDNTNNKKENLKILCPNCHSQTETWGSKNLK